MEVVKMPHWSLGKGITMDKETRWSNKVTHGRE